MKLAVLYAGQGAQHPGMGKEFYEASPAFRAAFDSAALDFDLHRVCFEDPDGVLNQTEYTQPCMVAFACGVTAVLAEKGVKPAYLAGLSLGEYSALQAAGVFTAKQAIELTAFRGKAMAEAAKGLDCGMTAVLGLDREKLSACCEQAAETGCVQICNYNCPGQLVIGGEKAAVEQAAALAKEAGARRCIPLKVSGPFHTKLMAPAGDALAQRFAGENFGTMETPVLFNCLGHEKAETDSIPQLLVKQVQSSVYMEDTLRRLGELGVDHILEVGPGNALSGLEKDPARGGLHRSGDPGTAGCGADRMEGSRMSEEKLTRAAIVTGGSRGIGRAVCVALAKQGCNVVVNYCHGAEPAEQTAALCRAEGVQAVTVQADVSTAEGCKALFDAAAEAFGRVDVLVNNAGITRDNLILRLTEQDFDAVLDTNLKSAFLCCKEAARRMVRQRYGRIVNLSSVVALRGNAGQTNYAASKAGLIGLTKSLARELAARNVTVNAVAPGFIDTDMTAVLPETVRTGMTQGIPAGRAGQPEDVAQAVAFFAAEQSSYLTGQVLCVDGGMAM